MSKRSHFLTPLAFLLACSPAYAGTLTTDFSDHLDQKVVTEGCAVTRRHETVFFDTAKDALSEEIESSTNYASLNGVWDFRYYDSVFA